MILKDGQGVVHPTFNKMFEIVGWASYFFDIKRVLQNTYDLDENICSIGSSMLFFQSPEKIPYDFFSNDIVLPADFPGFISLGSH